MQIITLGIGPGTNDIEGLVLTGLGILEVPPIPPAEGTGVAIGLTTTLAEGITYALPARLVAIYVYTTAATIQISNDGITWMTVTLNTNRSFKTSAAFIRSLGADSTITTKGMKPWQTL